MDKKQQPRLVCLSRFNIATGKQDIYLVERAYNTVEFVPGQELTKHRISELIDAGWTIEVK